MKKRVVFNLIVLFLNALSFAQVQEFQDDVIVEKIQNPRTSYLNAVIEPVVFTLFDEQFLLGGGLRFSAYHFVNRVSFEGGIERKYFNLESAYTKEKSTYLAEANFNPLLGTDYFGTLSFSIIHNAKEAIYYAGDLPRKHRIHQFLDLKMGYGATKLSTILNVKTANPYYFGSGQLYFLQNLQHLKFALNYKWIVNSKLESNYGSKNLRRASQDVFFELWYLVNDPFPAGIQFNTNSSWIPSNTDFIEVPSDKSSEMKSSVSKFPLGFFFGFRTFGLKTQAISLYSVLGVVPGYYDESFDRIFFLATIGYSLSHLSKNKN